MKLGAILTIGKIMNLGTAPGSYMKNILNILLIKLLPKDNPTIGLMKQPGPGLNGTKAVNYPTTLIFKPLNLKPTPGSTIPIEMIQPGATPNKTTTLTTALLKYMKLTLNISKIKTLLEDNPIIGLTKLPGIGLNGMMVLNYLTMLISTPLNLNGMSGSTILTGMIKHGVIQTTGKTITSTTVPKMSTTSTLNISLTKLEISLFSIDNID
jgi:hypothetical protein